MSEVEKAFEEWKQREDKVVEIDGKTYYRIIWSDVFRLSWSKKETLCVVPNPDMPAGQKFIDENGNRFTFGARVHLSFRSPVPEWYFEAGQIVLDWHETKEIGEYLTVWR